MVFNHFNRGTKMCSTFPELTLAGCLLSFVEQFRYLDHTVDNMLCDDRDINKKINAVYTRSNIMCTV